MTMLISIENARATLPKQWFTLGLFNAAVTGLFLAPFSKSLTAQGFIYALVAAALVGMLIGLHFMFRSTCGSMSAFFRLAYFLFALEFLISIGGVMIAVRIAERPDLYWLACSTYVFVMVITLLLGVRGEATALGVSRRGNGSSWRRKLAAYIDYSTWRVSPSLTGASANMNSGRLKSVQLIVAVGVVNVPLAFEFFGGERNNVAFIAVPILACTSAYINVKNFGPALLRLLLLRKLEQEAGRRFVNTDYEQIQELRRTFFLSRWLMRDYAGKKGFSSTSSASNR